ncbi:rhodanese-like domain-containing protein [Sedimenticola sp.]|uniref:rhodanese-like domain-containing protein n=1 Tax=Sedimenticola sp. TaxID=1940285 RepID=UPI003D1367D4
MRERKLVRVLTLISILLALLGSGDASARWPNVSAQQLLAWLNDVDPPLILDVRGRADYRAGTIAGALDGGVEPRGYLADGSGGRLVLLLPAWADERLIDAWFARLTDAGHRVWILQGGLPAWIAAGGVTEVPDFSYIRPGSVPFLIPRGLCEGGEPSQIFE